MDLTKTNRRHNPASGIRGVKKIYMIGIKGVGMTMLAQYLAKNGIEIIGSDTAETFMTDQVLKKSGIKIIENFAANNIPSDVDLIIYSTAYNKETNPEVARALSGKIKILTYAEALAQIFNQKYGIAVVGSHGKTTTTAWLGYVLDKAGLKPNVMVGARVEQFNGNSLVGKSDYLITEIDEYQNKLKYFQPKIVLLNNIEYDHPDFFPSMADYQNVFIEFIKKIPSSGFLIANFDDPIIRKIARVNCRGKIISYGISELADYVAYDIKSLNGKQYFKVKFGAGDDDGEEDFPEGENIYSCLQENLLGDFSISLAGQHNISNALAVIATGIELGIELRLIREYLEEFIGTDRRMQVLGKFKGATIIDDYAHHPTEILATLKAVRQIYPKSNLRVVFHPHTYTRTKALFEDFVKSFPEADEVIVLDIYGSAREKQGGVSSEELVEKIGTRNKESGIKQDVKYISTLEECEKYLRENIERGDVVILMGAGDVFRIGKNLVKE
ncbi:MAG: UDP-N-acetylmuramate--L-alanine ligase [Patescibacteria group bacterium]